jgi:hypothetical protein
VAGDLLRDSLRHGAEGAKPAWSECPPLGEESDRATNGCIDSPDDRRILWCQMTTLRKVSGVAEVD